MRFVSIRAVAALSLAVVTLLLAGRWSLTQTTPGARTIEPFVLPDAAGKSWALAEHKGHKAYVILFLGTQCPINNSYAPRLAELHKQYSRQDVEFIAINSNHHETAKDVAEHAKKHGIPFPVLRDADQKVAERFGAKRVPEAVILDNTFKVVYQGRIDDQFGIGFIRPQATRNDLAVALDEMLAGKAVSQPTTQVAGCLITRTPQPKAEATVNFAKHVSRIVQNRCQECHRPGQIGPFPLMTYEDASSWSAMIREVVSDRRIPPWHADPKHGKFANDRSLSKEEHDTLLAWIDQGCPRGDDKDLPPAKEYPVGWNIGKPDAIFTMQTAYKVPAKAPKGGIPYQNFSVKTNFEQDMYLQAAECKPGATSVVHHIIVYMTGTGTSRLEDGLASGFLVAWAPGDMGVHYPPGAAKKIPKGATLKFQMHYTPNGVAQEDRSSVGLVFAKEPPKDIVHTKAIVNFLFSIPAGADSHKVTSSFTFRKDAILWNLMPHMHLRGKDFQYTAVYPDGKREVLLNVPRYDFGWQANYNLAKPLRLPSGTKLECVAHFDNSKNNLSNPDPAQAVRWGEQTWQEMMIGFIDYSYVDGGAKK